MRLRRASRNLLASTDHPRQDDPRAPESPLAKAESGRLSARPLVAATVACTLAIAGCSTSTLTKVEPAPVKCNIVLTPPTTTVSPASANVSFAVAGESDCKWVPTLSAGASWITNLAPTSGQGGGQVSFRVAANTGPERNATVAIVERVFTVTQTSGCVYTINPTSQQIASSSGSGTVSVASESGCTWTSTANATWLSIRQGATGSGAGSVTFDAQANTGPQRNGTLTIAGRVFTVTQASGCTYTITPTSQNVGTSQQTGSVTVTTPDGCTWTAQVDANALAWLAITSGAAGSGNGTVQYLVAPLFFGSRTGTITIAGRTFTVTQS